MTKGLIRTENKNANTTTYINHELLEISNWLAQYVVNYGPIKKYQFIEIYYISELFKQYKTGEIKICQIIARINKDEDIKNNEMNTNIVISIITQLAEFLEKCNDNILDVDEIKKTIYEAYLKEAIRIISFTDGNDLDILFNKASGLDILTDALDNDIDKYLIGSIEQGLNENIFYDLVHRLKKILFPNENNEITSDTYESTDYPYHDVETNITSLIGE